MSRLIDADKIDFNEVFVGASEFAQDTRNEAQMLIGNQPTAFYLDKVVEQLEEYLFEKYCIEGDSKIDEIVKGGGAE